MHTVLPSRFAEAKLAENDARKRYAAAKGDNWRAPLAEWVEARAESLAAQLASTGETAT